MILYLLFPGLFAYGIMESQTANVTEDQLSRAERNHTFDESRVYNITKSQTDDELRTNQMSVIPEDDENFWGLLNELTIDCNHHKLENLCHLFCVKTFQSKMQEISKEKWCVMENIIRPYDDMTTCLENLSFLCGCYYPNPGIENVFLSVHSTYFHNCTREEPLLEDAPQATVIVLTLIPVSITPAMVYLVLWKNKDQD
ncbi:hypothetical protein Q5P01_023061 [Channa striata]|uniref:Uncharacterized protein n=1 Tax=Channa striata TaxID=64152 RepID=A0AA88J1J0_CHASR|nr:hypothetical protein Q5P01_023061 [Channa striata]